MFDSKVDIAVKYAKKYFHVKSVVVHPQRVEMEVVPKSPERLDSDYDMLRYAYKLEGMIPLLTRRKTSYILVVYKKLRRRTMPVWVNIVFLCLAVASTMYVGSAYYSSYFGISPGTPEAYTGGFLTFTLPLFAILGSHEMAHYIASRRHRVDASLPFFIPAPNIIGTFGALISVREPIPNRKALLDIGAAGPIAGFIMAAIISLFVGGYPPVETGGRYVTGVNFPPIYYALSLFFPAEWGHYLSSLHPAQVAVWVGFVVTAMNLFPVGQLDGGHIARALLCERAKYLNYIFVGIMMLLSMWYPGWLIFLLVILVLGGGITHPPPLNEVSSLDMRRVAVGALSFAILAVSFTPVPIYMEVRSADYQMNVVMDSGVVLEGAFESVNLTVVFRNTGNVVENVTLLMKTKLNCTENSTSAVLGPGESTVWNVTLRYTADAAPGWNTVIVLPVVNGETGRGEVTSILVLRQARDISVSPPSVGPGENVTVRNLANRTVDFTVLSMTNASYFIRLMSIYNGSVVSGETMTFRLNPGGEAVLVVEALSPGKHIMLVVTGDYEAVYFEVVA